MALPCKLKLMNLFNDGRDYMGIVSAITLPKLTRKLENYRGGGMNGVAPIDLGLDDDALSMEWSMGGLDELVLQQWGTPKVDGVPLRFAGAYQRDDTGEVTAVEVEIRGRHKEIDGG
ncbi:phage major tail tube protein, partial [Yersinia enterocolitica]|nr:phage major tail tube protein [Yersinia enterocolitica]